MEYYYLSDDRPRYPMTYPFELTFRGPLDRGALETALAQAVARHPLLRASIDDRHVRPNWIAAENETPWLDWDDATKPISHPEGERIDLHREAGLRTWVRTEGQTTRLLFQFHHACCDGLAVERFIEDVLLGYVQTWSRGTSSAALCQLEPKALQRRGEIAGSDNPPLSLRDSLLGAWHGARFWSSTLLRRSARLAVPEIAASGIPREPQSVLEFACIVLNREQSSALNKAAAACGVSRNDLLLRDICLAVDDWNASHSQRSAKQIWLNVPVDVRTRRDRTLPAANRIGLAFVSLSPNECANRSAALAAIHEQIVQIRRRKTALSFLTGLAIASGYRGLIKWALQHDRCFATMVHSNLGRMFTRIPLPRDEGRIICGDAVLERVAAAPPVRPLTHGAVAICDYAGELTISLRCDSRHFRPSHTAALLNLYRARIEETIGTGG